MLVILLVFWQGYSGYKQFKQFHEHLSERSVQSTSREILFLLQSIKDKTRLFSEQENGILLSLLDNPHNEVLEKQLAKKIDRYFPKHLTFTIANEEGVIQMKHSDLLIGKTCRVELVQYAVNGFQDNPINMHRGPVEGANHFDVLAPILLQGEQTGILFISFKLSELRRVLSHGAVFGHDLLLVNSKNNQKIELTSADVGSGKSYDLLEHYIESNEQKVLYSDAILDTSWELVDIPQHSLFTDEYWRLFLQGLLIICGFLCVAGLLIWAIRREEKKCGSVRGLLAGIEDERRRIAMDMHDQVLSELSHVSRETLRLKAKVDTDHDIQPVDNIHKGLNQITHNIRSIINDLHPHFLDIVGLDESIRDCLSSHLNESDSPVWSIDMDSQLESSISKVQRFNLYRIILEVVNNIQKHAQCEHFSILLTVKKDKLTLIIKDDGVGFDIASAQKKRGLGLRNIEMRALQLNAQTRWSKASTNGGTRFELTMRLTSSLSSHE